MTALLLAPGVDVTPGAGGFFVPVSCPCCSSSLVPVVSAVPSPSESSAVLSCESCGIELQLLVRLLPIPKARSAERARHRQKALA